MDGGTSIASVKERMKARAMVRKECFMVHKMSGLNGAETKVE